MSKARGLFLFDSTTQRHHNNLTHSREPYYAHALPFLWESLAVALANAQFAFVSHGFCHPCSLGTKISVIIVI